MDNANSGPVPTRIAGAVAPLHGRTFSVLAIAAAIAVLGFRFFQLICKYSVNCFYMDQWGYLSPFFGHRSSFADLFFYQHGPHRMGIGLIPDKFLYPLTHWNSRVDSFVIGIIIFAAMLVALQLKRKLFGPISYSDISIPVIFLSVEQYETLLEVPNPAPYAFPLLLLMLYCLALVSRNRLLRYTLVLILNVLLIYTGYGLVMGVVTVGVFLLECYWSWRRLTSVPPTYPLIALSVAIASFGSFFIHYEVLPRMGCFGASGSSPLQYAEFVSLMFSASVVPNHHRLVTLKLLGVGILLAVIVLVGLHSVRLLRRVHGNSDLVGGILLAFCLLFAIATAVGRLCIGLDEAYRSRHATLLIPAFLAIYFCLLSKSWLGKRSLVLALFVLSLLPAALHQPRTQAQWLSDHKRAWAACYVRADNIGYCNQQADIVLNPYPERVHLQQKLDYLKEHRLNFFYEPASK